MENAMENAMEMPWNAMLAGTGWCGLNCTDVKCSQ